MDIKNDPKRELRIQLFDAYIVKVFDISLKHLGISKYHKEPPALILNHDEDDIMGAWFDFEDNELIINYQGFDDSKYCAEYYAQLVYHEMIHAHQCPWWFTRYYDKYGHDYLTHPYELEAYGREHEILELI